jgi:hypothetical protein
MTVNQEGAMGTHCRIVIAVLALAALHACDRRASQPAGPAPHPSEAVAAVGEDGAREYSAAFLAARATGNLKAALRYMSPVAERQLNPETLVSVAGGPIEQWEITEINAADASSFEVHVVLRDRSGAESRELLFVGPGPGRDSEHQQHAWVIRGIARASETGQQEQ